MNQTLRYVVFVLVPFAVCGGVMFLVGISHGQPNLSPREVDLGDGLNVLLGGAPAAIIGAFAEYFTRKKRPGG